jgi:hypothetical protein
MSLPGALPRAGIRLGRWPADTSKTGRNLPPFGSVPKRRSQTAPPVFVSLPGARPRAGIRLGRWPAETSKTGRNLPPFGSVPKRHPQTAPPVFVSLPGARPRAGIRLGRWPAETSKTGRNLPPFGFVPKRRSQTAPPNGGPQTAPLHLRQPSTRPSSPQGTQSAQRFRRVHAKARERAAIFFKLLNANYLPTRSSSHSA